MTSPVELDQVVEAVLGRRGYAEPDLLPWICGLRRRPRKQRGAFVRGKSVYYDISASPEQRARLLARECARVAIRACGFEPSVSAIRYVAKALLTPRPVETHEG